jgi:NTP pyrophosphatase (non-canonical NTP hydrolase)
MENSIDKLTALQKEFGYKQGSINNVALFGLVGEAGEVLDECKFSTDMAKYLIREAVLIGSQIDKLKKRIRSKEIPEFEITIENEENLDKEMADVLYYLNVLAINRGKTLNDYAEISYQKVMSKKNK